MRKKIEVTKTIFSYVSLLISLGALVIAIKANKFSREASTITIDISKKRAISDVYLTLKKRYYEISEDLPKNYRDPGRAPERNTIDPTKQEEWRKMKNYWYHSFDEWYLTQVLYKDVYGTLWDDYYKEVIATATDKSRLRDVFCDLLEEEFREGHRRAFAEVVKDLYKARNKGCEMCPNNKRPENK